MAHCSIVDSVESIMKNHPQSSYAERGSSFTLESLQSLIKGDFLQDNEDEEPTSVLDLSQCISPPLQPEVWAQQQAAMEYDQQLMWEQQQIFLWQQQNHNQQVWEQQQLAMWGPHQQDLLYPDLRIDVGTDHTIHSWDSYPGCGGDIDPIQAEPWAKTSTIQVHGQENLDAEAQLQSPPALDDTLLLEKWMMSCSGESSLISVTDESSSPSLTADDLESLAIISTEQQQQQQLANSTTTQDDFGQTFGSCNAQQHLEASMDDQMLHLAISNFNDPTCFDQSSIMGELNPQLSNWFLPSLQHDSIELEKATSPVNSQRLNCPSTQLVETSSTPQFEIPIPVPYNRGQEIANKQPLQMHPKFELVEELLSPAATPIKQPSFEPEPTNGPKAIKPGSTSCATGTKSNKLWGPHRPTFHQLGNNGRQSAAEPVSAEMPTIPLSRKRSYPDFTADQESGRGLANLRGKGSTLSPAQRAGNNNSIVGNNSSPGSKGHGASQNSATGRLMTLAELTSGGVKMGGVQLPTVGTQIPSMVRLAMETQASGLGGVRMVQLLLACAEAVACRDSRQANILLQQLQHMASPTGDAMQRITACFVDGLTARLTITGSQPFKFSNPPRKPPSELEKLEGFSLVYRSTPYVAFGHFAANSAILEAFEGEERLHIIDLGMAHALQWPDLINGLAKRPSGPPRILRITGFGLSTASMREAGDQLTKVAKDLNVPFEFRAVTESLEGLQRSMLQLREGEALAVNSVLQLHCVVKESRGSLNAVLQSIHDLSPKILTLVEQDASHNGPFFLGRFMESLHYYSAIFDSLDAILPRSNKERVKMEQFHFAEEIKNIVSCEGPARVERHERVDQWRRRMSRAGFQPLPLKFLSQARMWLGFYSCEGYTLSEEKGCLVLGWKGKPIIAASSWRR